MSDEILFTDITRLEFNTYKEIQQSGVCNMMDWRTVEAESDYLLDKDLIRAIQRNYEALEAKYHA